MRKLTLTCLLLTSITSSLYSQTLFHFGKFPVDKKEFIRVYEKNAINQKPEYTREALTEYLDLYALFRMKVKVAEDRHLDTMHSIQSELDNYRSQLVKNYLTDEEVQNKLIREAYERMKFNVHVAHIMIQSSPLAQAKDTVAPYKLIDSIYNAIQKGADFGKMAALYSADAGNKDNGGDLGYLTALQTVYSFESVAYNTPVGKVSKPFKTIHGYHILKVLDKRPAVGEVKVAQILIEATATKTPQQLEEAKKTANLVYEELKKGANFEEMVKKYSEDRFTNENGGEMERFGVGNMVPEFENAAFALKFRGDISKPVKTSYGYHILKLVEKYPVPSYDSMKDKLKAKIERDSRSEVARDIFYNDLKEKNGFREYAENVKALKEWFKAIPDTGAKAHTFTQSDYKGADKPVFIIKKIEYKQSDLLTYAEKVTQGRVMGPKDLIFSNVYDNFVKTVLNDIVEQNLMDENEDFRNLMEEYRAGIMLFELMDRNVWGKASKDTAGLKAFHEQNKNKYLWNPGFRGVIYTFKNENLAKQGMKQIGKKGMNDEAMLKKFNSDDMPDGLSIERGFYEFAKFDRFAKDQIVQGKASEAKKNDDGTYSVLFAEEVHNEKYPKTLDEARGYVIADYQDYLEKKWNKELRDMYPVKVNKEEFEKLIKE
ncbi:MAG: peptidyl-prolyl cis-trans isomerase [Chitinophagales bacterium]|nr:peptidyl-prolyl cis-trans isomerase [Chitinophagaceae bacterium]MCB9066046.1 peptidyl-prolyl cis-trans isomerase [Chitinophagales bacterium]